MNMCVWISPQDLGFSSFGHICRSGIAGSNGNSIFSFFEEPPYGFPQQLYYFIFPPMVQKVPISLHPCQYLLSFVFMMVVILTYMRSYLIVVLICISLMISDVEHLFMCLVTICISSLAKCLFNSFAYFRIGVHVLSFRSFLYILDVNKLSDM